MNTDKILIILISILICVPLFCFWWQEYQTKHFLKKRERIKKIVIQLDENNEIDVDYAKEMINESGVFHSWQTQRSTYDLIQMWRAEYES